MKEISNYLLKLFKQPGLLLKVKPEKPLYFNDFVIFADRTAELKIVQLSEEQLDHIARIKAQKS